MPTRVLFAIGSMEVGGAERQLVRYLQHLDRSRFVVGLYLIGRRGPLLSEVPDDVSIFAFDERVAPSQLYWPGSIHRRQVRDLGSVLKEFRADLLVTRSFHLTLIGAPAARATSTPLVAIDASDPRWDFARHAGRFQAVKRRLVKIAYGRASAVIALSEGAANGISQFYSLPRSCITTLSSSVDLEEIQRLGMQSAPRLDPDRFHVVSVGRLVVEKGHRSLIEAAAQLLGDGTLPQLQIHLLGEGALRSELERLAEDLSIAGHVTFAGFRSNPYSYMRQCDAFCLPSLNEGMPGALLEAMACGVPVIASDCESGPAEMLQNGRFGTLVPVRDSAAIANAIRTIAHDPQNAHAFASAAKQHVAANFSTPAVVARLEALLEGALDAHRR